MSDTTEKKVHQGRNVKRFREMLGLKQEGLAYELGEDWTQRRISLLEGKEEIEPALLEQVAKVLQVTPEVIKNFTEEAAVTYFNTFNDNSTNQGAVGSNNYNCNFNPFDELLKSVEENKKLYERLLQAEKEKVALLEKMLEERR